MNLLTKINDNMSGFSKGQKLIANFITEHYDKAAFMTASKLGTTVGVSESTVVRFATELGYDGYPKMQKAMQEMIRDKLTSVQRIEVTKSRLSGSDVLSSVLNQDIEKIRRTLEETSKDDFANAVKAIAKAKTIYIFAVRSSAALASFLGYYYSLIFDRVKVVSNYGETEIYENLFRISEDDVIIGISFPRYSNAAVVDSLVAPLSMINALIVATVIELDGQVEQTFGRLESIWEEYDVYRSKSEEEGN